MRWRGPLADSYLGAVALVVFALVPFLMLSAAVFPLVHDISASLGFSKHIMDLALALADGAYAFGTVMAVQFASHLPARRMLLAYATLFLLAAVMAAWSPDRWVFLAAYIIEGLCTSLMLIGAVPPLVTGWPAEKMPWTGMIMNLCIFGAVAAGPSLGSFQAISGGWRPLFWGVAALAACAVAFAVLTFEDAPAQDKSAPWDFVAIGLAGAGCTTAFFGAGELQSTGAGVLALTTLLAGVSMIVALVVYEYNISHPLMPVRQLATTFPIMGVVIAMFASSSSFGLMELVLLALKGTSPLHTGLVFLPELGAAVATALLFAVLFRSRYIPVLAVSGLAAVAASAGALAAVISGRGTIVAAVSGLAGLGVGASVSPAMFMAGFSLRTHQLQRVFALIELLRGVTAFLVAPVLLFIARILGRGGVTGVRGAAWICLALAVIGAVIAVGLFVLGGARLQKPDLHTWQEKGELAWESPGLLGTARAKPPARVG